MKTLHPTPCEITRWVAQGKTDPEIADMLKIGTCTVSTHVGHILPKLGVENRTAAASFAPERAG